VYVFIEQVLAWDPIRTVLCEGLDHVRQADPLAGMLGGKGPDDGIDMGIGPEA